MLFFHSSKSIHQFLRKAHHSYAHRKNSVKPSSYAHIYQHDDVELHNVLGCQSTYEGQTVTSAQAWFNAALRPQKPYGSLGRGAQDGHLNSHTAPELCIPECTSVAVYVPCIYMHSR